MRRIFLHTIAKLYFYKVHKIFVINGFTTHLGAVYLSKVLMVNNILQILNLCGNNIGDYGITAIAEALQHNTSIMALYVRGCGITFSGAKSLAEALKINHIIKKLRIADNFVTVEGAKLILQSAVNNGVCQEVWINDEYQGDSNVQKLMGIIEDGKAKVTIYFNN